MFAGVIFVFFPHFSMPPQGSFKPNAVGGPSGYAPPSYDKAPLPPASLPPAGLPPQIKGEQPDPLDEFDDLTVEELKSLLDNFKNLSKAEQMDLIKYMKKLETTDPEKVKLLKGSVKPGTANKPSNVR